MGSNFEVTQGHWISRFFAELQTENLTTLQGKIRLVYVAV